MDLADLFFLLGVLAALCMIASASIDLYARRADAGEHRAYLARITTKAWCAGCNTICPTPLMGWDLLYRYRCPDCRKDPDPCPKPQPGCELPSSTPPTSAR